MSAKIPMLPDPFRSADGTRVRTAADWERHRRELLEAIVGLEYGGLPLTPERTRAEVLHVSGASAVNGAHLFSLRVVSEPEPHYAFMLRLLVPKGDGPFPVVLNGDGCWLYATEAIIGEVLRRDCILASFNRVEIVPDNGDAARDTGLYRACPGGTYGALAAWAWGYHRCVDVLVKRPEVDAGRIAVVGHSRGGKTVLLAGATDPRIALTAPNDSGCGGAGCFRWQGAKSETLGDILHHFPYWFGPKLKEFIGRETELPFDQHEIKALVAPRALLTTEALGDLWANPEGTWQSHLAAREVFRFLGAEQRQAIWYREGGHQHGLADWRIFLDVLEWQFRNGPVPAGLNRSPFETLPPAFDWRHPETEQSPRA